MSLGRLLNKYLLTTLGLQLVRRAEWADLKQAASQKKAVAKRLSRLEESFSQLQRSFTNLRRSVRVRIHRVGCGQESFLQLARLLSPHATVGHSKMRFGAEHDGGYVMLDDLEGIEAAFSFGVGPDCSWDLELAERGIRTYQFDHTVDRAPVIHPNLSFFKRKIVSAPDEDGETIGGLLDRYGSNADANLLLKMDIEGDEWQVLEHAERRHLRKFAQIVCEFHGFDQAIREEWRDQSKRVLQKLAADFEVVHVHGNNAAPFVSIGNVPFPRILEVTFANRQRYQFVGCEELFPTSLDRSNICDRADLFLGRFKF